MAEMWKKLDYLGDKYVEVHVRLWEKVPYLNDTYVSVPGWVAKLMQYPDSTTQGGKNLAYHVGHASAIVSILSSVVPFLF